MLEQAGVREAGALLRQPPATADRLQIESQEPPSGRALLQGRAPAGIAFQMTRQERLDHPVKLEVVVLVDEPVPLPFIHQELDIVAPSAQRLYHRPGLAERDLPTRPEMIRRALVQWLEGPGAEGRDG